MTAVDSIEDFLALPCAGHAPDQKKFFAVIGDPIAHSLSPAMHNRAFHALGMNAEYIAVHVRPDELAKFANAARTRLAGFNITVPHKSSIIPLLDSVSPEAEKARSVNTVSVRNRELHGDSTDGYGLEEALKENFRISPEGRKFMLVGAGGSSRALAFHFLFRGLSKLFIVNRSFDRVAELVHDLHDGFGVERIEFCLLSDETRLKEFVLASDVLIQSSSLGLKEGDPCPLPERCFAARKFCYDTIYRPTAFQKFAVANNCPCADGLSMLLHQGVRSFEIWTGLKPPIEIMREALEESRARYCY